MSSAAFVFTMTVMNTPATDVSATSILNSHLSTHCHLHSLFAHPFWVWKRYPSGRSTVLVIELYHHASVWCQEEFLLPMGPYPCVNASNVPLIWYFLKLWKGCDALPLLLWHSEFDFAVGYGSWMSQYLYQIWLCAWCFSFRIPPPLFKSRVPNWDSPFLKLLIFPLVVQYSENECTTSQKLVCH